MPLRTPLPHGLRSNFRKRPRIRGFYHLPKIPASFTPGSWGKVGCCEQDDGGGGRHIHRTWLTRPSLGLVHQKNPKDLNSIKGFTISSRLGVVSLDMSPILPFVAHICLQDVGLYQFCVFSQRAHMFSSNLRYSRLLRRSWPAWTKRWPHAARRLRRPAPNIAAFLVVWGITTRVSNIVWCVFVVLSEANHPIIVQEKRSWNTICLGQNSDQGGIQRSHVWSFQATLEIYPTVQCMCILHYHLYYIGDMCALVSSSTVRTNMHVRIFLERGFSKHAQWMEVSSKPK